MADDDKEQASKKGIASLTAKLLAVGALVGAVGTILANTSDIIEVFRPVDPPPVSTLVSGSAVHAQDCVHIDPDYLPVIPYSLRHNFDASPSLYWLKLEAENRCDEPFTLEVICDPVRADVGVSCNTAYTFQIEPHETLVRQIDPDLEFQAPVAQEVTLQLKLRVQDQRDADNVWQDTLRVSVLPQTTYFWDLENQPKEAVLASLAVWTVRPRASVGNLSEDLAANYTSIDAWMERAHREVFSRVEVIPDDRHVPPPAGRRHLVLETPEQVLSAGRANPVETALLFGALGFEIIKERSARIVLISAPGEEAGVPNIIFVAWESGGAFKAFDASSPPGTSFIDATARAAERLGSLLPFIRTTLNLSTSSGVFIHPDDERVVALDLGMTIDFHRLQAGLPQ